MPVRVDPVTFKNRPQTMIWVGVGKTPTTYRDGTVIYPFLTLQEACDWIDAQSDTDFLVNVSYGTYTTMVVPNKVVTFEGENFPVTINCDGTSIKFINSKFVTTPVITFNGAAGTVYFDNSSAINFGLQGGNIINGDSFTEGPGPHLLRADSSFSALDSAISTADNHVSVASGTDDSETVGVVYPSVENGKMALVWQSGEAIPGAAISLNTYYRNKTTGSYTSTITTQQIGNSDGDNFFVNIQQTPSQQIILSMLNPLGVWFSGEYAGPTASNSSGPLTGFGVGVGFARITKPGVLTNFKLTQAGTSGTTITNLQIYVAANGIPSLFAYTGVDLGVAAGEYISTDNVSTITVAEDDIVAVYNNEFFGWTPDAMTITADLLTN